jgi:hypothetical protein
MTWEEFNCSAKGEKVKIQIFSVSPLNDPFSSSKAMNSWLENNLQTQVLLGSMAVCCLIELLAFKVLPNKKTGSSHRPMD